MKAYKHTPSCSSIKRENATHRRRRRRQTAISRREWEPSSELNRQQQLPNTQQQHRQRAASAASGLVYVWTLFTVEGIRFPLASSWLPTNQPTNLVYVFCVWLTGEKAALLLERGSFDSDFRDERRFLFRNCGVRNDGIGIFKDSFFFVQCKRWDKKAIYVQQCGAAEEKDLNL